MSIFGSKPLTTQATSTTPFGGFSAPANTVNKPAPLFGGATAFGAAPNTTPFGATQPTGGIFSGANQQQNKAFSFGNFTSQPSQQAPFGEYFFLFLTS